MTGIILTCHAGQGLRTTIETIFRITHSFSYETTVFPQDHFRSSRLAADVEYQYKKISMPNTVCMRVTYFALSRCMFILLLLLLGGCSKINDWKDVWDKQKPNCRIEKIISYSDWFRTRTGIFSYNQNGDPVSIIFDFSITGASNFLFLYDCQHDLKETLSSFAAPYAKFR